MAVDDDSTRSVSEHERGGSLPDLEGLDLGFERKLRDGIVSIVGAAALVAAAANVIWFHVQLSGPGRDAAGNAAFLTGLFAVLLAICLVTALVLWHRWRPGGGPASPSHLLGWRWRWALVLGLVLSGTYLGLHAAIPGRNIARLELLGRAVAPEFAHAAVRRSLWYDLGFIVAYVLLLCVAARWAGSYYRIELIRKLRHMVSIGVMVAGVFDVVEDAFLGWNFHGQDLPTSMWRWEPVSIAAWSKFLILLLALIYVLGGIYSWFSTPRWVTRASWALSANKPEESRPHRGRPNKGSFGIALSGGGIRASSISLGALQALERPMEGQPALGWSQARAVTAVSGGSNMAAGWSITRSKPLDPTLSEPVPWAGMNDLEEPTPEEQHLIDNLGYLASTTPRGDPTDPAAKKRKDTTSFLPTAYATLLVGTAVNIFVLLLVLWIVARPIGWTLQALNDGEPLDTPVSEKRRIPGTLTFHEFVTAHDLALPGVVMLALGALLGIAWVFCGQKYKLRSKPSLMNSLRLGSYAALGLGATLLLLLWAYPEVVGLVDGIDTTKVSVGSIAAAVGVVVSTVRTVRVPLARFAPPLGGLLFAALMIGVAAYMTGKAAQDPLHWRWPWDAQNSGWPWLVALVLLALLQLWVSPEKWSLAGFYRGKLRAAYATFREKVEDVVRAVPYENDNATPRDSVEREPGFDTFQGADGPLTPLVVCTTSTTSSRAVRTHYGIPALSVTFDPHLVTLSIPDDRAGRTKHYETDTRLMSKVGGKGKRLTTMLPVAISSAAVSPAMGRIRVGPARMLLAFANVRLGVWMPNPRYLSMLQEQRPDVLEQEVSLDYARTGLGYLFKEFFGLHDLTDPFLYLTDGGHWENTGLVELLRSNDLREVICIDADSGPLDATSSLGKVIDLAPLECGVKISVNLEPLRAVQRHTNAPDFAERSVTLGFFTTPTTKEDPGGVGVLWYAKPALTEDMPQALLGYRETHHDFPTIATFDQFFDVSTYVAYRDLGRYNGSEIVKARRQLLALLDEVDRFGDTASILDGVAAALADDDCPWPVRELARALDFIANPDERAWFIGEVRASLLASRSA